MVVPLDDFDIILGIGFMSYVKFVILMHLGGILIMDENNPSMVIVRKSIQNGKAT